VIVSLFIIFDKIVFRFEALILLTFAAMLSIFIEYSMICVNYIQKKAYSLKNEQALIREYRILFF